MVNWEVMASTPVSCNIDRNWTISMPVYWNSLSINMSFNLKLCLCGNQGKYLKPTIVSTFNSWKASQLTLWNVCSYVSIRATKLSTNITLQRPVGLSWMNCCHSAFNFSTNDFPDDSVEMLREFWVLPGVGSESRDRFWSLLVVQPLHRQIAAAGRGVSEFWERCLHSFWQE